MKPPEEVKATASAPEPPSTNSVNLSNNDGWLNSSSAAKAEETHAAVVAAVNAAAASPLPLPSAAVAADQEDNYKNAEVSRSNSLENSAPINLLGSISGSQFVDAFSDLDPLGTGKIRPYIDKKYFFQDLKNPPKKVLKDLSEKESIFSATFSSGSNDCPSINDYNDGSLFDNNSQPSTANSIKNTENSNNINEFTTNFPPTEIYSYANSTIASTATNKDEKKTEDPIIGNNKALLVTDNDPFSPRMKKFDPFEDNFVKTTIDPFEFGFANGKKSTILPDTKIDDVAKIDVDKKGSGSTVFNGPLQVSLPPESYSAYMSQKRMERQTSEASDSMVRNRPNVFKQNTVDVISSISSKKMKPHIFSQKFSKRDSNSINMRRLQESDSLSESEAAPDPPPRPDSYSHMEPPPLPPKKQFSDIVIRPRVTSPLARDSAKYDYLGISKQSHSSYGQKSNDTPALPLPSRRIGRTESAYPGPGRPAKKGAKDEDDYLTPISGKNDVLILLPPPQTTKNRGRRSDNSSYTSVNESSVKLTRENNNYSARLSPPSVAAIAIPDITLSQLLTLGIDDLALKLNVSPSKLNTMTIVELTKYLSDFIEKSSQKSVPMACDPLPKTTAPAIKTVAESAIFKVSFDDSSDATFVAKFDENFGEDNSFVPNFDNFNESSAANENSVDRYAAFREIMEQEIRNSDDDEKKEIKSSFGSSNGDISDIESPVMEELPKSVPTVTKFDTKITQAISQAKDRYAALRDIILVEDLFVKPNTYGREGGVTFESASENDDFHKQVEFAKELDEEIRSSPEINISINLEDDGETEPTKNDITPNISYPILICKDDLEIDEYMNRAISNLSLDSRDHLSPLSSKSPISKLQNASTSPIQLQIRKSPLSAVLSSIESIQKATLNDQSTSPIPIVKSPMNRSPLNKSPLSKSPMNKSPMSKSPVSRSPIDMVTTPKSPNLQALADIAESHLETLIETNAKPEKVTTILAKTEKGLCFAASCHFFFSKV